MVTSNTKKIIPKANWMVNILPGTAMEKQRQNGFTEKGKLMERLKTMMMMAYWLGGGEDHQLPITPEIEHLRGKSMLCVWGKEESDSGCATLSTELVRRVPLEGGHHFDGDYDKLGALVLAP